jgi:hypothetical protein
MKRLEGIDSDSENTEHVEISTVKQGVLEMDVPISIIFTKYVVRKIQPANH